MTFKHPIFLSESRRFQMRQRGFWGEETILDYFDATVARRPDHLAVVDHKSTTGNRHALTYRELDAHVEQIAGNLRDLGIGPGDIVSVQLPNWWEFIALHLAAMRLGAVTNPLMPIFRERELSFMLELAETKILIMPSHYRGYDYRPMAEKLQKSVPSLQHVFFVGASGPNGFDRLLAKASDSALAQLPALRPKADDVCELLFTSGTTGEPKGVIHTSNTLWGDVRSRVARLRLDETDIFFMPSPLAHQTGFLVGILMPICTQGTSVLQDIWNGDRAVSIIRNEGATLTMASTPFLLDLTDAVERQQTDLPSFRLFIAGGAPIPRALVRRASRTLGAAIVSIWGMTECGASTATDIDDPVDVSSETDGKPNPGAEIRVIDQHGNVLPPNREGQLQVRAAGNFVGYLKRPNLYKVDSDGWLDTGDLGVINENGYLRITGRTKDVIIRGGENIPVVEIENLLFEHASVAEVAIVPYPDERLGERACAFVVLKPGCQLSMTDMTSYLLSRECAKNYLPERLEVVTEMPRTPSGKIQKFVLRDMAKALVSQPA